MSCKTQKLKGQLVTSRCNSNAKIDLYLGDSTIFYSCLSILSHVWLVIKSSSSKCSKSQGNAVIAFLCSKILWKECKWWLPGEKTGFVVELEAEHRAASSSPSMWSEHTAPAPARCVFFYARSCNRNFHSWPEHVSRVLASVHMLKQQYLWGTHQSHRDRGIWPGHNHEEQSTANGHS